MHRPVRRRAAEAEGGAGVGWRIENERSGRRGTCNGGFCQTILIPMYLIRIEETNDRKSEGLPPLSYRTTSPSPSSGKEPETHCGGHDGPPPLKTVGSMAGDVTSVRMCFLPR